MAKFGFMLDAAFGVGELGVGFSWGAGGIENTAFYTTGLTVAAGLLSKLQSRTPAEIAEGVPSLSDKRIFFDLMGSSLITAFMDFDLKIYERDGTKPLYQSATTSIPVIGTCTNSITINTNIWRGGIVGDNSYLQFMAGMLKLIRPEDLPPPKVKVEPVVTEPQFCGYSRGARLRALLGQCP